MREWRTLLAGLLIITTMAGCSGFAGRRWGGCALAGAFIGGGLGATGAGLGVDKAEKSPVDKREIGAAIGAGALGGAMLGALLGHVICDPEMEAPPPPPVAAAPPPPPPPAKGTKIATIGGAQFDFNKATIKPSGRDVLDKAVKTLKDNPDLHVVIEGHTDSVGSDSYNLKLSERRAAAVKTYLVGEGISATRITTRGYGKTRPVASNETEAGRAQNRRADVVAD